MLIVFAEVKIKSLYPVCWPFKSIMFSLIIINSIFCKRRVQYTLEAKQKYVYLYFLFPDWLSNALESGLPYLAFPYSFNKV